MNEYLCHHGIKDQRWGFRRFQNKDGSLTPAGRERYRRKSVRNLTDEEIAETMDRLNKEKELLTLQGEVVKMASGRKGKLAGEFIETFAKKAVTDVVANVSSQVITYTLAETINKVSGKNIVQKKIR